MAVSSALYLALDLANKPLLAGVMRQQPLPSEVLALIRIAAGCTDTLRRAEKMTGQDRAAIQQAAVVYLQQMLFAPGADPYRVLGVRHDAPHEELREHMHWLMKWLHPDRSRNEWESAFAERVLSAWDALKTLERRQRYDRLLHRPRAAAEVSRSGRPKIFRPSRRIPWITQRSDRPLQSSRRRWRITAIVIAAAVAAVATFGPNWAPVALWRSPATPRPDAGAPSSLGSLPVSDRHLGAQDLANTPRSADAR